MFPLFNLVFPTEDGPWFLQNQSSFPWLHQLQPLISTFVIVIVQGILMWVHTHLSRVSYVKEQHYR